MRWSFVAAVSVMVMRVDVFKLKVSNTMLRVRAWSMVNVSASITRTVSTVNSVCLCSTTGLGCRLVAVKSTSVKSVIVMDMPGAVDSMPSSMKQITRQMVVFARIVCTTQRVLTAKSAKRTTGVIQIEMLRIHTLADVSFIDHETFSSY